MKIFQLLTTKTGVVREFKGHTKKVFSVCFSPDGEYALSGSVDNTARLWDVKTAKCYGFLKDI
jgi:WD40 repeat protein